MQKLVWIITLSVSLGCIHKVEAEEKETNVEIGGAVRLNYGWKDYGNDSDGKFDFELFRIDADVEHGNWFLDAQYRWYQGFEAVHHAEVGYKFSDKEKITLGVTQVPFGIEPYASHSFWFGGTYYLGFEDDYDTGIKWRRENENWIFDVGYFFNSEYDDSSRYGRYSFDIASTQTKDNKEEGHFNGRLQYVDSGHKIGASVQAGQFINNTSMDKGDHWAAAVHYDGKFSDWNLQAQFIQYHYDAEANLGTSDHRIALSAFEYPFEIATRAQVSTLNISKTFSVKNEFVDSVTCYNDSTFIKASNYSGLDDSIQNVTGCLLVKGGLYTYIDWIAGKNMWFSGGSGIGVIEGPQEWNSRLNINIGYYF